MPFPMPTLVRLERPQKEFLKSVSTSHIIHSYSFGIETTNKFKETRSSL